MDAVKFILIAYGVIIGALIIRVAIDYFQKKVDAKQEQLLSEGKKSPAWLEAVDVLLALAKVASTAIEGTVVKAYKEGLQTPEKKLTPEQQQAAWRSAVDLLISIMPAEILSQLMAKLGISSVSDEALYSYLKPYVEAGHTQMEKEISALQGK